MTTLNPQSKKSSATLYLILLFLLIGGGTAAFFLFFEGKPPTLAISSPEKFLGAEGKIVISADDTTSGLRQVSLTITQGDKVSELFNERYPRSGYTGMIGVASRNTEIAIKTSDYGLKDGPATLVLTAADYSLRGMLRGNRTTVSREIVIDMTAPKISILHSERYINPGGSGIVIYRVSDPESTSGAEINGNWNPGFPVGDGRDDTFIAYFAVPYDAAGIEHSNIVAHDPAGNTATMPFSVVFKNENFKQDRIDLSNGFLENKIPEFKQHYPEMHGDLIDQYLYTNNQVRDINNQKIAELCRTPTPERLWKGHFIRMPGSARAGYADHRTYYYNDQPVDKQVHLGIDIASTRQSEVRAAEKGIVTYADYLGIYGNLVLLDHGQGVFSLYSHLSQINVSQNDQVDQGTVLGLTGTTGMAGGDHLHFSMLINGVFVTPKEWWDQHWIEVTIEEPLTESRFR